jgi:DNA-binding NtrC family response regulator
LSTSSPAVEMAAATTVADRILLVEDRAELRQMLLEALFRMGYEVVPAASLAEAESALASRRFSAVLTDLKLPAGSGMDVLRVVQQCDPATPVIIMTAYGSIADAVAAMKDGACDFIQKPIDLEHLRHLLARAIERQQLLRENIVLKQEYAQRFGFPRIVGESPAMQAAAREMQRIASSGTTVLLLGESGTGKELFARAIHQLSPRAGRPMVALNCAAIPENLMENELFGHERGAFTGANTRKLGKFELAHGGTIFLDEIGELPLSLQGKLLRVLEERKLDRLGGLTQTQVDVRIIAATNRDLEEAVAAGSFRRDLYYRLSVFPIQIPPLRERGDDVLLLAAHMLERFRRELRKPGLKLADDALQALRSHSWPGNVRELQNTLERAAILYDGEVHAADLNLGSNARRDPEEIEQGNSTQAEREQLESVLRECKWNKNAAAQRLGISYKTLLNRIHTYGLD